MLITAFTILGIAVLLGSVLAFMYIPEGATAPSWRLAASHGLIAIGGLGCLGLALRGPPRGVDQGAGSFGMIAAALIALAAVVGFALFSARLRKRRLPGALIGIHATLAISGFIVLLVYVTA